MTTPRLGAPELTSGQATPETTVNEQIRYVESGAGHFIFKDRDLATPPGSPADGDCYLVAASGTGAWSGHDGEIAFFLNTAWVFIEVIEGFTAWINDENLFIGYDGAAWGTLSTPAGNFVALAGDTMTGALEVPDDVYDATGWNGNTEVPTKNAVRDKIETMGGGALTLASTVTQSGTPVATSVGFLGSPQISDQDDYTLALTDAGGHYYHVSGTPHTLTIPANASIAFPIGTVIAIVNEDSAGDITLAITSDTLRWTDQTGSRTVAENGTATLLKVTSTVWRLTGDGIT